jgi:hypothetical protein
MSNFFASLFTHVHKWERINYSESRNIQRADGVTVKYCTLRCSICGDYKEVQIVQG